MNGLAEELRRVVTEGPRAAAPPPAGGREAAVLLLADPAEEGLPLLFVQRAEHLRLHAGQIGLPGGSREAGDPDVIATALREAAEEVGVDPGDVEVLGTLPPRLTRRSGLWLTPVVGLQRRPIRVRGDGHEVAEWFWVSLEELLRAPHRVERWGADGEERQDVHFYEAGGRTIWGVTGEIVHDLLALLGRGGG